MLVKIPTRKAKAYILSTGTELSIGRSHDTNAPYLAKILQEEGFFIHSLRILPDSTELLKKEIKELILRGDNFGEDQLIIMTGGLGPTIDDHTLELIAEITKFPIVRDIKSYRKIKELEKKKQRNRISTEIAMRMARTLEGAFYLENHYGLAPGFAINLSKTKKNFFSVFLNSKNRVTNSVHYLIALPGVPNEMKNMFRDQALPLIQEKFCLREREKREVFIFYLYGIGESAFQKRLLENPLAKKIIEEKKELEWGIQAIPYRLRVFFHYSQSKKREMSLLQKEIKKNFIIIIFRKKLMNSSSLFSKKGATPWR